MPRVKRGNKRRLKRKKILRRAKGYYLAKSKLYRIAKQQVDAVVLACTELEMIVDVRANVLPIYDSTLVHARAGAEFILSE